MTRASSLLHRGNLIAAIAVAIGVAGALAEHRLGIIPDEPQLPDRFQITFYASDTQSSPLENLGTLVTIARDGTNIGIHYVELNSSVYYTLDCASTDTNVSSVQVSWFNVLDHAQGEPLNQQQCWYAPPGTQVSEGTWTVIREILNAWAWQQPNVWDFGGYLRSGGERILLWSRQASLKARHEITYSLDTGEPTYMLMDLTSYLTVWEFIPGSSIKFADNETVTLAYPPDGINCTEMPSEFYNYERCPAPQPKRRAMQEGNLNITGNGEDDYVPNWRQLEAVISAVARGAAKYTGDALFAKDYPMLGNLTDVSQFPALFFPMQYGMDKPDVRNQRGCGSCWAFGTAASLSSVYSNKHGVHYTFSPQFFADCVPKAGQSDSGCGCWGGDSQSTLDFLIASGSVVPLDLDYPYAGVQGLCNTSAEGVSLNLTGYSVLNSTLQAMDALMNRGAISIAVYAGEEFSNWGAYGQSLTVNQLLGGEAMGLSCQPIESMNHIITLLGWAPCMVRASANAAHGPGLCWVVQNSWGTNAGTDGLWLIDMDPRRDCGINRQMVVPLLASDS